MRSDALTETVPSGGSATGPVERRDRSGIALMVVGLILVVAFVATWPDTLLVGDEAAYVNQAHLFAQGTTTWATRDARTGLALSSVVSDYPPGTSLWQTPFVALGGWRAAGLGSLTALLGSVWILRGWLRREGRSPWFALLVLVDPAALVMGRIAMSDAPSMFLVTAALALFWRGLPSVGDEGVPAGRRWSWPLAGLLMGLSLLFRETNALMVAPFVLGALVRREIGAWRLLAGAAAGVSVRLGVALALFDDAFYVKPPGQYSGLRTQSEAFLLLVMALVVLVPGGLIAVVAYRGRRRPELLVTVPAVVLFFAFYGYSAAESGLSERLVLAPRYVLPVVPLVVFALAEATPRWVQRWGWARPALARVAATVTLAVAATSAVGVHLALDRQGRVDREVARTIYRNVPEDARLVVNAASLRKSLGPVFGPQAWTDRNSLEAIDIPAMVDRPTPVYLVLLDRQDSRFRNEEAIANQSFLDDVSVWARLTPVVDRSLGDGRRLRISRANLLA